MARLQQADLCMATLGSNASESVLVPSNLPVVEAIPMDMEGSQPPMAQAIPMSLMHAPVPQQIARAIPPSSIPQGSSRLELDGIGLTGDCCFPSPPPVFICCCSDITAGGSIAFQYDSRSGMLLRPEKCNQRLHVEWGNYRPGSKVLSFRCGCFDCPDNEQWDLFTDGTIRPRRHPDLAVGMGQWQAPRSRHTATRTILVSQEDERRLVFRSVLQHA